MLKNVKEQAKNWLLLSRVPFISSGVLPFVLGPIIALRLLGVFNPIVFGVSLVAVVMIILATHYNGEVFDLKEDQLSSQMEKNAFSGGSQVLVEKKVSEVVVKRAGLAVAVIALAIGLLLQFYFKTGPWTLSLGLSGLVCGFFYSKPPLRWAKRGIGEMLIAYCYGWLTIASGFYLQTAKFSSVVNWVAIPVALTIFNVILINEFPDYPADKSVGKINLLVRIGKRNGAIVYILASLAAVVMSFVSLLHGAPLKAGILLIFVSGISLLNIATVLRKGYENPKDLEMTCALTILVNLLMNASYIIAFIWG